MSGQRGRHIHWLTKKRNEWLQGSRLKKKRFNLNLERRSVRESGGEDESWQEEEGSLC